MNRPLLCVTVAAATTAELRKQRDDAAGADLVELRLDSVGDPDVEGALAGRTVPVIVTCRPAWEGGGFGGSEADRKGILAKAIALGAEYVDLEWRAGFDDLIAATHGQRIVLSMHDFDGVPADLQSQFDAMQSTGAQIVKVAVKATRLTDCVTLVDLAARSGRAGRMILIGMGEHGLATRVLAGRFRSAWTYAGVRGDVGQISARGMCDDYRFQTITDATKVFGIVGGSVTHSVSPAMHNAAFRASNLDAVYIPLPAATADDAVTFGKRFGISGASVTIPYKVALVDRLDEVCAGAQRIGAVNTIRVDEAGRWIGDNTDADGFLQPLHERVPLRGLRASVLGAGGAARAVAVALASNHCTVSVHARRSGEAERLALRTSAAIGAWPPEPGTWDLLVNCTPIGQSPSIDETPVPMGHLTGRYVYDLVYNPPLTRLLREAATAGCQTLGGLEMLVAQAQAQFRWWTGAPPPAGVMKAAALKKLGEPGGVPTS